MSRNRTNLRRQPQACESDGENGESGSSSEEPQFLDYLGHSEGPQEMNPLEEFTSPVREKKPPRLAAKPNPTSNSNNNQEAVENHRRIYRQLGIHVPEPQPNHPLMGYRFVLKLFLATNSKAVDFLNWSGKGTQLELNYLGLQEHLTSGRSIFHCRNASQFTALLQGHGFERVRSGEESSAPTASAIKLLYRNPNFVRGQLGKLEKIEDHCPSPDSKGPQFPPLHLPNYGHIARMIRRGDLCSTSYTCRSPLQIARCNFQTLLNYQADAAVLKERNSHDVFNQQVMTQLNVKTGRTPNDSLPDPKHSKAYHGKFVKPHESVINIGIGQAPDYAGYYGKVELSKVNEFFSEYLPRYGSKITGYKDIVMDATNKSIGFQQNLPIGLSFSDDEDDVLAPLSSGLEMDFLPSTSAAGKPKSSARRAVVEDSDLEQAMQELCGSNLNEDDDDVPQTSSSSKLKAKPKPKAKAKPTKRLAKRLESSSSESEEPKAIEEKKPRKPKKIKLKAEEDSVEYVVNIEEDFETEEIEEMTDEKVKDLQYDEYDDDDDNEEDDFGEEDDDDYVDKYVQYRTAPEPPKRRRYDLRNSKRSPP
ncbi:glutamic acid-rich protein [Drosophila biarmipes]|uniref:glutamic acid-rich protein n=1 Tax=Drosophila biarmipes TaxID=125945 RepID=UPI0007E6B4D8|nr:glutamic acid-rich protein [Drosophila biarmipes]